MPQIYIPEIQANNANLTLRSTNLGVGVGSVLPADSRRVAFYVLSDSANLIQLLPHISVPNNRSYSVAAGSSPSQFSVGTHPGIVQLEWFARLSAATNVLILEILLG